MGLFNNHEASISQLVGNEQMCWGKPCDQPEVVYTEAERKAQQKALQRQANADKKKKSGVKLTDPVEAEKLKAYEKERAKAKVVAFVDKHGNKIVGDATGSGDSKKIPVIPGAGVNWTPKKR